HPGLLSWAGGYLGERLVGMGRGARMLHQRLLEPGLSAVERSFVERLVPAFDDLASEAEDELYVEGTAKLFAAGQIEDANQLNGLMRLLHQRLLPPRAV